MNQNSDQVRLASIRENLEKFKSKLEKDPQVSAIWEIREHFRKNWAPVSENPVEMYRASIRSDISRAFWVDENYQPREMMSEFFKLQPDITAQAFRELYNEELDLLQRMDRFVFYCDQLLGFYKAKYRGLSDNNHYHDYRIISLYLSLKYPEKYVPYRFGWLVAVCETFQAHPIPGVEDPERYFKIARAVSGIMKKDEQFVSVYKKTLKKSGVNHPNPFETLYPSAEFCAYCSGESMP
ncbi:MAG: hypothetical protein EA411_02625 [Saprospirales bacterium]|nr:MAG: hypothetical protein EA411_02625 [Saprospirales bacterium]